MPRAPRLTRPDKTQPNADAQRAKSPAHELDLEFRPPTDQEPDGPLRHRRTTSGANARLRRDDLPPRSRRRPIMSARNAATICASARRTRFAILFDARRARGAAQPRGAAGPAALPRRQALRRPAQGVPHAHRRRPTRCSRRAAMLDGSR